LRPLGPVSEPLDYWTRQTRLRYLIKITSGLQACRRRLGATIGRGRVTIRTCQQPFSKAIDVYHLKSAPASWKGSDVSLCKKTLFPVLPRALGKFALQREHATRLSLRELFSTTGNPNQFSCDPSNVKQLLTFLIVLFSSRKLELDFLSLPRNWKGNRPSLWGNVLRDQPFPGLR